MPRDSRLTIRKSGSRVALRHSNARRPAVSPFSRARARCPTAQTLSLMVHDEKGGSTADGTFRVFPGLRSDPFCLAWIDGRPGPNLLQHDNVLCVAIEFDTRRVLDV